MTFAQRYIHVAESTNHLIADNHPDASEETPPSSGTHHVVLLINQMLDLIEDQMLMGLNYFQWAKYEICQGMMGIGLTLKRESIERKEIKRHIVALLHAIDEQDPVAIYLKRMCPEPSRKAYQSLADAIADASNQCPLNPWGKCLLGLALLGYKTKTKEQEASECLLDAVLLLRECSNRAQKAILLTSVLQYCSL